jgi:LysM repeat protein
MPKPTTYRVVAGDTLFKIARQFNTTVDALKKINGLTSNNLSIGQTLKLAASGGVTAPPPVATPPVTPPANNSGNATYRVVAGDTLSKIARQFKTTVDALKKRNGLTSNNLSIGQVLQLGASAGTSTPPLPPVQPLPPTPLPTPPINPGGGTFGVEAARAEFVPEIIFETGFQRFLLRVRVNGGAVVTAILRDHVNSIHTIFPNGLMYGGQSQMELDTDTIQSVGVTPQVAKALQFVSIHEGKFDAINSYDRGIFSYGFIQFAGASAVGASLNRVMASMELNAPEAFNRIFKRVGIDTEAGMVTVLDHTGNKLRGDDAWLFVQRDVRLYGAFIQAGFEPSLVREQIRMANDLYVQPALNFKLNLILGGIRISIPRLVDVINSEAALTVVIAIAINQGVGGMGRLFATAINNVAAQSNIDTGQKLPGINELAVIQDIAANTTDERIINRINGVLNAGLSFV